MAITKERLQELINKEATIYYLMGKDVCLIYLNEDYDVEEVYFGDCFEYWLYYQNSIYKSLDELYETEDQAKWRLKYHATRTEELDLPTWEEFITDDKYKYHYGLSFFDFDNYRLVACIPTEDDNTEFIGIDVDRNTELYHWDKATEENYEKACDLCLKLFKGEEE